jgi:type IV pilus assembly protein PilC
MLAWHTRGLLQVSAWMNDYLLPTIGVMAVLIPGLVLVWRFIPAARVAADLCLLRLPLIGPLAIGLSLSRYATVCGRLYRSGVKLDESLAISEALVSNLALRQPLAQVRRRVVAGASLGDALAMAPSIPGSFRRLIAAGESAGSLGQALQQAGQQYQQHARQLVERIESLAGPVLLVWVGANLLWIVVSVLGPVYDAAVTAVLSS